MKKAIKIGTKEFKYKKDAINYYKNILNSYEFNEVLSEVHYNDIINLLVFNDLIDCDISEIEEQEPVVSNDNTANYIIEDIRIGKVQFNTKCFELLYSNGDSEYISYRQLISKPKENFFSDFSRAARNVVRDDIRSVKQKYFENFSKKGLVPCQETGVLSRWTELVVDHRQPNTFSVIVDRFIELNKIDIKIIKYEIDDDNFFVFRENDLVSKFRSYHKEKAILRIVRKECNSSRAYQGRVKKQSKDLKVS